jgi:phosphoribosylglycinamide formyltransferase-1
MNLKSIAIFASHNGSGFDALYDAILNKKLNINISLLISNNSNSNAIKKAQQRGINNIVINEKKYPNKNINDIILNKLNESKSDYIFLSGYMKKIDETIIDKYSIYNAHPSLLPKFGGKGMYGTLVHKAVIESNEKYSGITIHKVTKEYDDGEIVLQKAISIKSDETVQSLENKIKELEKIAIVEAFANIVKG